jgi:hypothetical protein
MMGAVKQAASHRQLPAANRRKKSTQEPFRSNLSGKTVMALVNAFQNSSHEASNQNEQASEATSRLMKIRSVWAFPVKGSQQGDHADSELRAEEAGESATPSSFIT